MYNEVAEVYNILYLMINSKHIGKASLGQCDVITHHTSAMILPS